MSFKKQKTELKTAKCLLQYNEKYYVAVNKKGLLSAVGGKGEPCDRNSWECLLREIKEETGVTEVTRVNGPFYEQGTNYYHVHAHEMPRSQPGEVRIVALSLEELKKLSDKEKCYTLGRVMALFIPFHFIAYKPICHPEKKSFLLSVSKKFK